MSKAELLLSDDFKAYRVKELEEGANMAREFLKGGVTPDYAKGALEMLRRILLVPKQLPLTDKQEKMVQQQITKEFDEFHFQMVKRFMEVES